MALRWNSDHVVLSQTDDTLSSELIQHRTNVVKKRGQLASFARSCSAGNVGRFEAVFDYVGLDPNLIGGAVERDLDTRFRSLLTLALHLQIIAVSTGDWWKKLNWNPFVRDALNPFLDVAYQLQDPTTRINDLRRIYDLEIIVYYWSFGCSKNRWIDTKRLYLLISDDDSQLPFHRPKIRGQTEKSNDYSWFDPDLVDRHGYVQTVGNHITFLLKTKHVPCRTGNLVDIFSSMLNFYALYCANSWHLEPILLKSQSYRALDCFTVETVQRQRMANKYKRNKPRSITMNTQSQSYLTVFETMLWPHTLIGQIILNIHVPDHRTLQTLRHDHVIRSQCIHLVRQNVHAFPTYLINSRLPTDLVLKTCYWYSWCIVSKNDHPDTSIVSRGLMMGRDKRFHPYKRTVALSTPTRQPPITAKNNV